MADVYVVLTSPALVGGTEYDTGAVVPVDSSLADDFGTSKTQVHADYTAALWTSNNPTMTNSQFGIESDTGLSKIGDGSTAWADLEYAPTVFAPVSYPDVSTDFTRYAPADTLTGDETLIISQGGSPVVTSLTDVAAFVTA